MCCIWLPQLSLANRGVAPSEDSSLLPEWKQTLRSAIAFGLLGSGDRVIEFALLNLPLRVLANGLFGSLRWALYLATCVSVFIAGLVSKFSVFLPGDWAALAPGFIK